MSKSAFDAKRSNIYNLDPDEIVIIGLDTGDGPEHPLYDDRVHLPLDEKLYRNIKYLKRIIENCGVRKNGPKAECTWGRQRIRCARKLNAELREAGLEPIMVPCTVERGDDGRMMGMMISENEARRDSTPLIKARTAQRYIEHGRSEEDAAEVFGVSVKTIQTWLSLLDLDKSVQALVEKGKLSATAAGKLVELPRDEQKQKAKELVDSGNTTSAAAERAASGGNGKKPKPLRPSVKEIRETAQQPGMHPEYVRALKWVLGEDQTAS